MADLTGHFNFIDTDCYYQLRRLVYFLENFPKTLTFDPLADWPTGSNVDWPDGFIYIVGLPLKLFGLNDFKSLEIGACVVMILLGLLTTLFIYFLAKRLLKDRIMALLVLLISSTNFLLIRFSCLGEVDHHILEALFPCVMILLSFKAFEDKKTWAAVVLGLTMTLFLWVSSSSIFVIGVFFVLYAFIFAAHSNYKLLLYVLTAFTISFLPLVWYYYRQFDGLRLITHPSLFHLSLIYLLAALSYAVFQFRRVSLWIIFVIVCVLVICSYFNTPSVLVAPLRWAISYVFGHEGALQSVSEAAPIFMDFDDLNLGFMHSNFGYFVYLLPLVWVQLFRLKKMDIESRVLIISLSMLAIPAVSQKRFCHIMMALFLVYLGWCLMGIHRFLKQNQFRIAPMFTLLFLGFSLLPGLKYGFSPEGSPRDRVDHGISHFFVENVYAESQQVWDRLALKTKVDEAIFVTPNIGHLLQYITGLGVISNSFYHPRGFDLDFKIRQVETDSEFREVLRANKIRYIILVDDFKFLELEYKLRNLPTNAILVDQIVNGQRATIYQMQELMKYAWVRWLLAEGDIDHFKTLFRASFIENYFYKNVAAYRLEAD